MKRLLFSGLLLIAVITIIFLFKSEIFYLMLSNFSRWLELNPVLGAFIFIALQGLSACFLLPVTTFGLLAGAIFPFPVAVFLALIGNQIGIILAITTGRTFLRPWVESKVKEHPKMKALDRAMTRDGFKLAILLRLTPVFPFGVCNWIFASSKINAFIICLGSLIGNIPNTIIHASVGSIVGPAGKEMPPKLRSLSILLTICFALGTSVFITLLAKRALRSVVNLENTEEVVNVNDDYITSAADSSIESPFIPNITSAADSSIESPFIATKEDSFTTTERQILIATFVCIILALVIGISIILN